MLSGLNWRLWAFIGNVAVIAALAIALLATRATLADEKRERVTAEAKLSLSNASIDALEGEIARMRAEAIALSQSDEARMEASRQAVALAEAASRFRQAAIERLEQSAAVMMAESVPSACEASPALLSEWK